MKKLTLYLLRHLTVTMLFVTLGLTMVIWLTQALRLIEVVVEGGAPMTLFLQLMMVTLPTFLSIVLPIAVVAAVLFTYNRLLMDSELVVMRAVGLGPLDLAKPALLLAVAVTAMCLCLTLWIAPAANRELVALERLAREGHSTALLREGVFNEIDDGLTVYVRRRDGDGELRGLVIHDARLPERPVTLIAERGVATDGPAGQQILVYAGQRQEMDRATGKLSVLHFDRYAIGIQTTEKAGQPREPDARERSTADLVQARASAGGDPFAGRLVAELHQRLTTPVAALGFAMVGVAALLTGEFNRRGQARRIAGAAVAVVVLQSAGLGATNLAANDVRLIPLMWLVALLPAAAGAWFLLAPRLRRVRPAAA